MKVCIWLFNIDKMNSDRLGPFELSPFEMCRSPYRVWVITCTCNCSYSFIENLCLKGALTGEDAYKLQSLLSNPIVYLLCQFRLVLNKILFKLNWLVGCFGFNGHLRQYMYFNLY